MDKTHLIWAPILRDSRVRKLLGFDFHKMPSDAVLMRYVRMLVIERRSDGISEPINCTSARYANLMALSSLMPSDTVQ